MVDKSKVVLIINMKVFSHLIMYLIKITGKGKKPKLFVFIFRNEEISV